MSEFLDAQSLNAARLSAVAPNLTQNASSVIMRLLATFGAYDADTNIALTDSAPNIAYTSARGAALDLKGSDYNQVRSNGTPATDSVIFYQQSTTEQSQLIANGSSINTGGGGTTQDQIYFKTGLPNQPVTAIISGLPVGGTPTADNYAVVVPVTCAVPGVIGNVGPGTIIQSNLSPSSGIQVTNATSVVVGGFTISNPNGGNHTPNSPNTLGIDRESDAQFVNQIAAVAQPLNALNGALTALLALPNVFDAYIADPGNATGYVYVYWVSVDGTAAGIPGTNTVVASGAPDSTNYSQLANATSYTSTALSVMQTIAATLLFVIPRLGAAGNATSPFNVVFITGISVTYSAPTAIQSTVVEPAMGAAIMSYIQSLVHNQIPTTIGAYNAVTTALSADAITNFIITSITPSVGSASLTTIYRLSSLFTLSNVIFLRV